MLQWFQIRMSNIDHLARFLVLVPIRDKSASVATVAVERLFSVFSAAEIVNSDQGVDVDNELVKKLQAVFDQENADVRISF